MSNNPATENDLVLTDSDFAMLAYILGAYLGEALNREGPDSQEFKKRLEMTSKLKDKLIELQNTR